MEGPWVNKKIDAVAAHGSPCRLDLGPWTFPGVTDLFNDLGFEVDEFRLANCPEDMAKADDPDLFVGKVN